MRASILAVLCTAFVASFGVPASAVTRAEIVRLAKSGVSDVVILAVIDRDKTIFALTPDDLVALQGEGVSQAVVLAMLKSGRAEGEAAFAAQAAQAAAERAETAWVGPGFVVVGHGPDRPNSGHGDSFYGDPWFVPVGPFPVGRRSVCVAHVQPGPAGGSSEYFTGCPAHVQRSRGKLAR
jgi:hypothetical protein